METVDKITQVDDTHLHWEVSAAGRKEQFDAVITEQIPDTRIAWTTTDGPKHAGVVDFHKLSDETTQIMVVMDTEAEGLAQKAADAVGLARRQVRKDLERFKELIESRGRESGAWRGEVSNN
jgi:uncharacterized membrane protein